MKRARTSVLSATDRNVKILVRLPEDFMVPHGGPKCTEELVYCFYKLPSRAEPTPASVSYRDGRSTVLGEAFYKAAFAAAKRAFKSGIRV